MKKSSSSNKIKGISKAARFGEVELRPNISFCHHFYLRGERKGRNQAGQCFMNPLAFCNTYEVYVSEAWMGNV
jgi:hypothetical protein